MTLPEHMIAVCIAEPGGPEALTPCTRPVPQPDPADVLIRVAAAGINGPDLAQRRGLYAPPPGASPLRNLLRRLDDPCDLDALRQPTGSLTGFAEYARSKLAVMLFHRALQRRGVQSFVADPGDVASDAWRHVPWPIRPLLTCRMKPPGEGARTPVFCATERLTPGLYCDRAPRAPGPLALDDALAEALWRCSEGWTGLSDLSMTASPND